MIHSVIYARTVDLEELKPAFHVRRLLMDALTVEFPFARFADYADDRGTLVCDTDVDALVLDRMRCFAKGFVACAKARS